MLFALLACVEPTATVGHDVSTPVYTEQTTTCDAQIWSGAPIASAVECSDIGTHYRCESLRYVLSTDYATDSLTLEPQCADMNSDVLLTLL
jgi:hypothetical protein